MFEVLHEVDLVEEGQSQSREERVGVASVDEGG